MAVSTPRPTPPPLISPGASEADPPPIPLRQRLVLQTRGLWSAISKKEILLPTVFIFLWQVGGGEGWRDGRGGEVACERASYFVGCRQGLACNSAATSLSSPPFPPRPPSLPPTPSHPLTLLVQATPSADTAMFFYQTNKLGFTPEFLGRVSAWNRGRVSSFGGRGSELSCLSSPLRSPRPLCADPALPLSHQIRLAGAIASLAGVALYNTWLKKVPLKKMLMWVHRPWIGWPWIKAHPP